MNRHKRRANARTDKAEGPPVATSPGIAKPAPVATSSPGVLLRVFGGLLLSTWVIKRVNHPDVLIVLRQLAQQTGRTEAANLLATKLRAYAG